MKKVTLYSTHCPKCKVLETKLKQKGISFEIVDDTKEVTRVGREHKIMSAPILQIGETFMSFTDANHWINDNNEGDSCDACKL